jgi:S-disulfanyl-L-cysteine oxidoreductase SoxD
MEEEAVLQSRCSDDTGYAQPTLAELLKVRGLNSVYHLNAIQSWHVASDGAVTNGSKSTRRSAPACHGAQGQGGPMDRLVGGVGSLDTKAPIKTIGSYWPYATTVFDYIRRAMPFDKPGTLSSDQVYAVTAYLLYMNKIVPQNAVMNAKALAAVKMPNRDGFTHKDPRPDTP